MKLKTVWLKGYKSIDGEAGQARNAGAAAAPSKRILAGMPEYDKVAAGIDVAEEIGLTVLRDKCRHFNGWLEKL